MDFFDESRLYNQLQEFDSSSLRPNYFGSSFDRSDFECSRTVILNEYGHPVIMARPARSPMYMSRIENRIPAYESQHLSNYLQRRSHYSEHLSCHICRALTNNNESNDVISSITPNSSHCEETIRSSNVNALQIRSEIKDLDVSHKGKASTITVRVRKCARCRTKETTMWRRGNRGEDMCNACRLYELRNRIPRPVYLHNSTIRKRRRLVFPFDREDDDGCICLSDLENDESDQHTYSP